MHGSASINVSAGLPPFHEQLVRRNAKPNTEARTDSTYVPGPGHYEYGVGFDKINTDMKQVKEMQSQGLDVTVIQNTTSFKGVKDRFKDIQSAKKALLPGPGSYEAR